MIWHSEAGPQNLVELIAGWSRFDHCLHNAGPPGEEEFDCFHHRRLGSPNVLSTFDRSRGLALRFGWVSLLQDLGSKMVVPLVPLFLSVSLGASPLVVGAVEGAGTATAALVALFVGRAALRRRLMPMVRFGYGLSSIAKIALAATTGWGLVLLVRVVDRAGKGVRDVPRDLILADSPAATHGRVFGTQQALDKTGGFLGPLAGLAVFWLSGESFRTVFVVAFVPCALSVALLWGRGLEKDMVARAAPVQPVAPAPDAGARFVTRMQGRALVVVGLQAFAFVPTSLLLLRASAIGMSVSTILVAYALLRLVTAAVSYPAGVLADRFRSQVVVSLGALCAAVGLLTVSASASTWKMFVGLALVGAADACTRAPVKAWLLSLGSEDSRGPVLGARTAVVSAASAASAVAVGMLWGEAGEVPLALAAVLAAAVGVLVWAVPTAGASPLAGPPGSPGDSVVPLLSP